MLTPKKPMAMHWLLRLCYLCVATLYSIFGLLLFGNALAHQRADVLQESERISQTFMCLTS